ncbi:immune inhibitor A domain-containing protein [Nocardioides mangrovi]|uniref:Immune inhibitor A n=1 Tax=Nocardioides mangrovi TaxID=2874580 RepID=A0ABS7UEZ8_9ACTN|nr:immune inhibitor A domain-containing protein [Nocardioides mangrovi]MBZ5739583.1 immune inhibitor A [Nocardioides mangrovi]
MALTLTTTQAGAAPAPSATPAVDGSTSFGDSIESPLTQKYDALRQEALQQRLRSGGKGAVEKLGKGRYAKVAQTGTDRIFVVLAEFGDTRHSAYPDDPDTGAQRFDGPMHNQIPKPDRKVDNSTLWEKNYSRSYFENMYFNRMKKFYEQQSGGTYSIDGDVTEWVKVPFNEARYGNNNCGDNVCNSTWFLIRDALAEWTQMKLDAGWDMAKIQAYLKTFDKQDRYDFDGDGNFNEPDGYIDHFQIVHAGGDEADGDPIYGTDAIWSHRWNAQIEPYGTGPEGGAPIGGVNVGEGGPSDGGAVQIPDNPTGVWVNDYTIQPENGGLSVFAHEFGHDLGLPDLYDTNGGSNSVEHWSLMSQSRGTLPSDDGIGDQPQPFGAWDKYQLGWLDYDVARAGRPGTYKLRPNASTSGSAANGLIVLLPDKQVTEDLGEPCSTCGSRYFYSDKGDDLDNTATLEVDGGGALTAKVNYEIEDGFDYAFLEATSDGETWTPVETNLSYTEEDQSGFNDSGFGLSGTTDGEWVDLTADVPDGTTAIRWRYRTDGGYALSGFRVDEVTLDGTPIGTAETDDEGWDLDGFYTTTGSEERSYLNAYFVDNRQYVGRDKVLGHVYNFGRINSAKRSNWVDFFKYQPGALISYWDTSYTDNNVGDHPGGGEILPVDAHPEFQHAPDGTLLRTKIMTSDSTFSLTRTKAQQMHYLSKPYTLKGQRAVPTFDDTLDWWFDSDEHGSGQHVGTYQPGWFSVDVPKTGTTISVAKVAKNGVMTVKVGKS